MKKLSSPFCSDALDNFIGYPGKKMSQCFEKNQDMNQDRSSKENEAKVL